MPKIRPRNPDRGYILATTMSRGVCTLSFKQVAVAVAQDLLAAYAGTSKILELHSVVIGQITGTFYFIGGEDLDFESASMSQSTTSGYFRSGYARCAIWPSAPGGIDRPHPPHAR